MAYEAIHEAHFKTRGRDPDGGHAEGSMDIRGWLNRVAAAKTGAESTSRIDEAVERVVQVANPRLRFVPRYRKRLAPAVRASLEHVEGLVGALPAAREVSAAAWSGEPYM